MKTKLLKKLRKKFSKRFKVKISHQDGKECFGIYDDNFHLNNMWDREKLHLRLRDIYFDFLEESLIKYKKYTNLTYWW